MLLNDPPITDAVQGQYAAEREADGYVWNVTRLWCWRPDLYAQFGALRATLTHESTLTERDRAILVLATASALGDSYCSFAWARRFAAVGDDETAARVIAADPTAALSEREQALADWARKVV